MIQAKTRRIELRTDLESKKLIEKAANLRGQTVSSYILGKIISVAKQDIKQSEMLILDNEDRNLFYSLIKAPPEPNAALRELLQSGR